MLKYNISDLQELEIVKKKLRESEMKYNFLIQQVVVGIFMIDPKGQFLDVNGAACDMFGYAHDEILKMRIGDLVLPEDRTYMDLELNNILSGKISVREYQIKRKNGRRLYVEISLKLLPGGRIQGIFRDNTIYKQMEKELLKASNLEAIGALAGGFVHDFNNIISVIVGNTAMAKMKIDHEDKDKIVGRLERVEKAALQAKKLTQKMIILAKGGVPVKKAESIKDLLEDEILFILSDTNISCVFSIADDLMLVHIDWVQISQVINNLVINAMQAMPDGGIIDVKAENIRVEEIVNRHLLQPGNYVKISVKDNGTGISPQNLDKIFDPYFTTKEKGTGLGLSTSYSTIHKHGGLLTVESEIGIGTTFHIYLPSSI